jgi:hypothetical protein
MSVDEMTIDKMTAAKMSVDELTIGEMNVSKMSEDEKARRNDCFQNDYR